MVYVQCPICQCDDSKQFIPFGPKDIVRCRSCDLVYVTPRHSAEDISKFYEKTYMESFERLDIQFGSWRLKTLQREADFIQSLIPAGKVLDVGCATGEFLSLFPESKWIRYGIEPSLDAVKIAKSRGVKVYQGVLQDASLDCPDQYFNVITNLDTIFFSPTPIEDLKKVRQLLLDDGVFVVEIPGFLYRMLKNVGPVSWIIYRRWCHLSSLSPHLFYYSDKTFRQLLDICGFKVEKVMLEQSPVHGESLMMFANAAYFSFSKLVYKATFGKLNFAAKVTYLCKKK